MNMPIIYLPINYPDKQTFFKLLDLLEKYNIQIVELGIPVTQAYKDGPLIQNINEYLLNNGLSRKEIEASLAEIKKMYSFQVILMTYAEAITLFSLDKVSDSLYDGILCVDNTEYDNRFSKYVELISPDMSVSDLDMRLTHSNIFVYLMSVSGKTGGQVNLLDAPYKNILPLVRERTSSSIYVGFGLKTARDVQIVINNGADGGIIGSEFLRIYQKGGLLEVSNYLQSFASK